jgi:hypothetical protein
MGETVVRSYASTRAAPAPTVECYSEQRYGTDPT